MTPLSIIQTAYITSEEFGITLAAGAEAHKSSKNLTQLVREELQSDNLKFEDYSKAGPHWHFLDHFFRKLGIQLPDRDEFLKPCWKYQEILKPMNPQEKMMTIFSREQELHKIFLRIKYAHKWDEIGFGFYNYYLRKHIELDSMIEQSHSELVKRFHLDPEVLKTYWQARLDLYNSVLQPINPRT